MKEALNLALEALTYSGLKPDGNCDVDKQAITAIKEALAQDEKGLFIDLIAQHEGLAEELALTSTQCEVQPEQEPLGFMNAGHVHEMQQGRLPYGYVYPKGGVGADIAVYTTPPKRPWVRLTDEDVFSCYSGQPQDDADMHTFANAIDAKLKELNT